MKETERIIVVSGLPRSGTSMMMRMLEAGGVQLVTDGERVADADNPRGYYECEAVKSLSRDASWLSGAGGKAIKVISILLTALPEQHEYAILFMERDLEEVLASQRAMLLRRVERGEIPAELATPEKLDEEDMRLRRLYQRHLKQTRDWLAARPEMDTMYVAHADALKAPRETAHSVSDFLALALDLDGMTQAVDPRLHRQRRV